MKVIGQRQLQRTNQNAMFCLTGKDEKCLSERIIYDILCDAYGKSEENNKNI